MSVMAEGPKPIGQPAAGGPPKPPMPPKPPTPQGAGALRVSLIPSEIAEQAKADPRRWLAIIGLVLGIELVLFGITYAVLRSVSTKRAAALEEVKTQIAATEKQIKEMSASVNDLSLFSVRSSVVAKTLDQHSYLTRVFSLLEKRTLPSVRYSSAAIDIERGTISLSATALKYQDVVKQVLAYRNTPDLTYVGVTKADAAADNLGNVSGITFSVPLRFKPAAARFAEKDMPAAPEPIANCSSDKSWSDMMACLDAKFEKCSGTVAEGDEGTAKLRYEILGRFNGLCEIRFRYLANENKEIALRNADCRFDMAKPFHVVFADALAEDFASCSGQLPAILKSLKQSKK